MIRVGNHVVVGERELGAGVGNDDDILAAAIGGYRKLRRASMKHFEKIRMRCHLESGWAAMQSG